MRRSFGALLFMVALFVASTAAWAESPGALAASFPAADGQVRMAIFFGLPAESVSAGRLVAKARLLGLEQDKAQEPIDAFDVTASVEAADLEGRRQIQVYGDLVGPPGEYRLALEISVGEGSSNAVYPLTLERQEPDRPMVLPPMMIDDEGQVAAYYERADLGDAREPPADYPLIAAGEAFVPDVSPRFGEDVPRGRICLIGRFLTGEKTFLETGMVAADGTLLGKERLALVSQDEAKSDGLETLGFETLCFGLDLQGLVAGLYQLNVTLHDFERRTTERSELSFEVLAGSSPAGG